MGYPTEAKHGVGGYRNRSYGGLSRPVAPAPRPVVPARPPLPIPANSNVNVPTPANLNLPRGVPFRPLQLPYNLIGTVPGAGIYVDANGDVGIDYPSRPGFSGRPLAPPDGPYISNQGYSPSDDPLAQPVPMPSGWVWNACGSPPLGSSFVPQPGGTQVRYWVGETGFACANPNYGTPGDIQLSPSAAWDIREGWYIPVINALHVNPTTNQHSHIGEYAPVDPAYEFPIEQPWVDPVSDPVVTFPTPNPRTPTYPETLPEPGQQPSTRPEPGPRESPAVVPMPQLPPWVPGVIMPPAISPSPGAPPVPVQPPSVVIRPGTGPTPDVSVQPGSPGRTPPGPNTREQKGSVRGGGAGSGVRFVVNAYTEANDFINALYAGVPRHLRRTNCHPYDMYCQLMTLYDVFKSPEFNAAEFVEAFINNQFEDMIFGIIGSQTASASQNMDILTGLNRAINAGPDAAQDYMDEHDIEGVDLLPELTHDAQTDAWSLQWDLFGVSIPLTGQSRPVGP